VIKVCKKHGKVSHFLRSDGAFRCGQCASGWVVESRRTKKDKLIKLFGGKCAICGYHKYNGSLDFHHKDPKTKSFALSVKGLCYSWETILKEAKKCVVLCKNCHMEVEAGIAKV
jgi:predicted Zn-ribbon and HTH transcriptional regulator